MKPLSTIGLALKLFAASVGLASIAFWVYMFYVETFGIMYQGRRVFSVAFLEPNKLISGVEFVTSVLGFVALIAWFGFEINHWRNRE